MKKMIVLLSLFLTAFITKPCCSQEAGTKGLTQLDKEEVIEVKNRLTDNAEKLSSIAENLKRISASMSAFQEEARFLIMHSRENIMDIVGIYRYVADNLDQLLVTRKSEASYYAYLEEYGFEQMRRLQDEYSGHVLRIYGRLANTAAAGPIDEAETIIRSSSWLLDKAVDIIEQQSKKRY